MEKPLLLMYHLTTEGRGGETLRSLFERHAVNTGPQWVPGSDQRNGFYVRSHRRASQVIGETPLDDNDDPSLARRVGRPVLVTVACDFSEGWDIDYEDSPDVAKTAFFNYAQDLAQAPPGRIALVDGTKILAIRAVEEDERDGLEIDVQTANAQTPQTLFMSWDSPMDSARLMILKSLPQEGFRARVEEMNREPRVSEYALLQGMRDYLVETKGDEYRAHEEKVIRDAINREERLGARGKHNPGVSLKYYGDQPLPILKVEMLGRNGRWTTLKPPAGTGGGSPPQEPPEHSG